MVSDVQIRDGITALLQKVEAPAVPLEAIHREARAQRIMRPDRRPFAIAAAAAVVIAALSLPIASPGVVQTLQEKIAAILHWTPPTQRPTPLVWKGMRPETVSLGEARARVHFRLVVPAGVPSDASGPTIAVSPTGVYSRTTGTWSLGPAIARFYYKRSNGRMFGLTAQPASTQTLPPSKFMFEDRGVDKAGNPILVRYERFVWRNGDQIMTAIAGDGIDAAEIVAIRTAMHGTAIPGVWPAQHRADAMIIRVMPPR
jgi:hypothetical protein